MIIDRGKYYLVLPSENSLTKVETSITLRAHSTNPLEKACINPMRLNIFFDLIYFREK